MDVGLGHYPALLRHGINVEQKVEPVPVCQNGRVFTRSFVYFSLGPNPHDHLALRR